MQSFFSKLAPFIALGILIVILVVGIVLLSYLLIIGAVIGFILFIFAWIKEKFFPSKDVMVIKRGRIFEHDDKK